MPPFVSVGDLQEAAPRAADYLADAFFEERLYEWEAFVSLRIGTLVLGDKIAYRIIREGAKSDILYKLYQDGFFAEEPREAKEAYERAISWLDKYDELSILIGETGLYDELYENITSTPYWDPEDDFGLVEGSTSSLEA